jgi:transcriptional regulator with XRE-family HTH domain
MRSPFKRGTAEMMSEDMQVQEIEERHHLSQQIFFRRQQRDWTQERLAAEAGLTQAQVATVEAGQANPTFRTLVKLASALGCNVADLCEPDEGSANERKATDTEAAVREVISAGR